MYNARGVLLLALFMSCKRIKAYTIEMDFSNLGPGQHFETLDDQKPLMQSKLREPQNNDETVTVTAKIWYVSDFHGKNTRAKYQKLDQNCKDNETTNEYCERKIINQEQYETIPEEIRNSWDKDTPHNRAQAVVNRNLDYMNHALANSEIPIRYVQWGSVQDIGQTEAQIGSGYTGPGGPGATRTTTDVFESVRNVFGDSETGRTRLYQTADVVILLLNNAMKGAAGECNGKLFDGIRNLESRFAVFAASYDNGWLFSHETGHCLWGMHLKPKGYTGPKTNWAYCPPDGEFGTIEAYVWMCTPGPSGEKRRKVPYFSNPNVLIDGVATGTETENNAATMKEQRFNSAAAGTNCFDGYPDEAWMRGEESGTIGNNCPNGEESYEPPLSKSLVNCEFADWEEWNECDKPCNGGSQRRTREVKRHAWYGGKKCHDEDSREERQCNEDSCPVCDNGKQLDASKFTCEDSGGLSSTPCTNVIDGDESTVWASGLNSIVNAQERLIDGKVQWGFNTSIKVILDKETIVSSVQITNKVDQKDFYENYKTMKLQFSNGYEKIIKLGNGKMNEPWLLENPLRTSYINFVGITTWGQMPDDHLHLPFPDHTGFRSGLSEIRLYGCDEDIESK